MNEDTRYRNYILQKVQSSIGLCYDNKYSDDITLNIDNIGPLLTSLGIKQGETEILDLIRNALIDANGYIDPIDLEKALVEISLGNGDHKEAFFGEAFSIIDLDNDGYITAPDIYRLFQIINIGTSDEGLITLLKNLDYDKDGKIDFEDFRSFMLGLPFLEPQINIEDNCDQDDEDAEDEEDDDHPDPHLNIEALRERRPSLRKLTKEDSKFHLVSENKRSLFSYAGVVKDTSSVVSYLRRISNADIPESEEIQERLEAAASQLTVSQDRGSRRSSIRSDISDISRLVPPSGNRRRTSISSTTSSLRDSFIDDENSNFLQIRPANLSRRPSLDSSCQSLNLLNTEKSSRNVTRNDRPISAMRSVVPKTVLKTDNNHEQSNDELLCLKDLCLTITDTDSGNDSGLTMSQTVNGLVQQASGMANRRNSGVDLNLSGSFNWDADFGSSPSRSPAQPKRQLSIESSANEFGDDNSSVKCSRDNYDPDDMTSATRNNLFEFHKITSKSSHSIGAESTSNEQQTEAVPECPGNWNTETPRSKKTDMKPFFSASTPTTSMASPRSGSSRIRKTNVENETEDVYVSLVEKYHRPLRRYRRRISNDSDTVGKCLKVRTLKKTKSFFKSKKKNQPQDDEVAETTEIRVPTAGQEDDKDEEDRRLREERLKNFVNAEPKSDYVKIENFEIPLSDTPRTPSFPNPKRSLSNSLHSRPQTARQMRYSYPQQYILGDTVTSKHLANTMNSPRTLEEYNDIHSGYIVGHITYEKPTINGMQPLKTRKDSAPGVSTWQHEFPSVGQSASRPKTAIGMKRTMFCRSNIYLGRPFTARTAPVTRGSNLSERDSLMSSNETLSSHNLSDNERKDSQTTSKQAQFGESRDSAGYSSEDTSDLGNSFNENDFIASRVEKPPKCEKCDPKKTNSEILSEGCQIVPSAPQGNYGNVLLQAAPQKSPYSKRPVTPKSPMLMTRKSYPLGNRDEPLNDDAMPSSRRPQTARPVRRGSIHVSQPSYPTGSSSERSIRVRPKTAVSTRKQSITSTSLSMNIVDMSPRPSRSRPVTARTRSGRAPTPKADTEDLTGAASEATCNQGTDKVITDSFPGSAVRRRRSVHGSLPQTSSKEEDNDSPKTPTTPKTSTFKFEERIEGECVTPRSPKASILRRPKSSVGHGFSKLSPTGCEINVVDMTETFDKNATAVQKQRPRSFKPLTQAIMALNQTRRLVVQNSSISRSLETKGILLQHDDLSKTKVITHDAVPVISGNPPLKTKTVITLEIPQI